MNAQEPKTPPEDGSVIVLTYLPRYAKNDLDLNTPYRVEKNQWGSYDFWEEGSDRPFGLQLSNFWRHAEWERHEP